MNLQTRVNGSLEEGEISRLSALSLFVRFLYQVA